MAAASVVIGALPLNRKMTMYIDSMATIQALAEGPLRTETDKDAR